MVELTVNGIALELAKGTSIKYTKQVADIFDIGNVANSYTNAIEVPPTPHNTETLQFLGIVGDTSTIPYSRVVAALSNHGLPLIKSGWLNVKEKSDNYKISVIDGMIDFFKAIENKTMGSALNLDPFNHEKNIETVIASFTNDFYKYIIADYNGLSQVNVDIGVSDIKSAINIDYMVPCFNVGKLFEIVMATFGFTYTPTNVEELSELYLTYPKSPQEAVSSNIYADYFKDYFGETALQPYLEGSLYAPTQQPWSTSVITTGNTLQGYKYQVVENGLYKIEGSVEAYGIYKFSGLTKNFNIRFSILVNGVAVVDIGTSIEEAVNFSTTLFLNQGDIVDRVVYGIKQIWIGTVFSLKEIRHNSTYLKIFKTNQGNITIADAFKDYSIKDFFKDCLYYTGTVPVIDTVTNNISFVRLNDKLNTGNAVDYSDKFVSREKELYVSGSLAQKNAFTHKYNQDNDTSADGYLYVNNQNLEDKKTLVTSKIYAPEEVQTEFFDGDYEVSVTTKKYRIWDVESKENSDGEIETEYKGLNGRFYWVKPMQSPESTWYLTSKIIGGDAETVPFILYADNEGGTFSQIVPEKYSSYQTVLDNLRAHTLSMAFSLPDFLSFDMNKPIYIGREASFYIANKISFEEGKLSEIEALKITKPYVVIPEQEQLSITVWASDEETIRFRVPKANGYDFINLPDSIAVIGGDEYNLTGINIPTNPFFSLLVTNISGDLTIESFSINVNNGSDQRLYVYNSPAVSFTPLEIANGTNKTINALIQPL